MSPQRTDELIRALRHAGVELLLVGGVAAAMYGSSYLTFDLDVLMPFTEANWERVDAALAPFEPRFHGHPGRIGLHPPAVMAGFRMAMLDTTLGRLDLLREIPGGTYEDLRPRATTVDIFGGPTQVLALDDLIESKARLGRDKDKPVVIELRAIREKLRQQR